MGVVPGSHRWSVDLDKKRAKSGAEQDAVAEQAAHAIMSKGSVVVYTGSVWHSGGNNVSSKPRIGLNVDYNLGWLRQEENQYLACPPHIAKDMPKHLQKLLGYGLGGY